MDPWNVIGWIVLVWLLTLMLIGGTLVAMALFESFAAAHFRKRGK